MELLYLCPELIIKTKQMFKKKLTKLFIIILVSSPLAAKCQLIEKISFDASDSTGGYYLAVRPASNNIKGVLVLLNSFRVPESMLPETRLHNVGYANNILTVFASMNFKLYADSAAVLRINAIMQDIVTRFSPDTAKFALAGHDFAGSIALRYTELTYEHLEQYPVQPKAVFGVDCPIDLFSVWHCCEREIKKNFYGGTVSDATLFLNAMKNEKGTIYDNANTYKKLTPFNHDVDAPGNERFLKTVAVRLYYDNDIEWQLKNRGNGLYDSNIPDATELISRLMLAGNKNAEFVAAKRPGYRANGTRSPNAMSIVEESECIDWVSRKLNFFNPNNPLAWAAPYTFPMPQDWTMERAIFPPSFSPNSKYKGFEEIHFPPGWGDIKTEDYWTVSYLFRLDGKQKLDAISIADFIKIYFEGLIADNARRRNIPADKIVPISAQLKKTITEQGDIETYTGMVNSLDYMAVVPITFNCRVHIKAGRQQTPVLIEISPKPFDLPIWQAMEKTVQVFNNDLNSNN